MVTPADCPSSVAMLLRRVESPRSVRSRSDRAKQLQDRYKKGAVRGKKTGSSSQGMTVRTRGIFRIRYNSRITRVLQLQFVPNRNWKSVGQSKNDQPRRVPEIFCVNLRQENHRNGLLSSPGQRLFFRGRMRFCKFNLLMAAIRRFGISRA